MFEGWKQKMADRAEERRARAQEERERVQQAAEQRARNAQLLEEAERSRQRAEAAEEAKRIRAQREIEARRAAAQTPQSRLARTAPPGAPVDVAVEAHLEADLEDAADTWRDDLVRATRKHIRPGEQVLGVYLDPHSRRTLCVALTDGFVVKAGAKTFRSNAPITQDSEGYCHLFVGGDVGHLGLLYWPSHWLDQVRDVRAAMTKQAAEQAAANAARAKSTPLPAPRLIRTARDAELVAAEWMQVMGFPDARVTGHGADGGIDVLAEGAIVQVKAEAKPVGRPVLQQLAGAAGSMHRLGACFALAGYTPQALGWAQGQDLALFSFDLQGVPVPVNERATALMTRATTGGTPRPASRAASVAPVTVDGAAFRHGDCPVRHRTAQAAARCPKG